jgi:uncharacterized RDD family membrane protein YckC
MKTPVLQIRTPEGIVFSQQLAGPVTRFLALSIDLVCIAAITSVVGKLIGILQIISMNVAMAIHVLAYFVVTIGYGIVCEWAWRGQTLGKRIFRLRVVDAEGLRIQFSQIVVRNLLRFVDALPIFYFLGGLVAWFSPKCQRLGDIAASTVVIRMPTMTEPDLEQLLGGKFNSLRQHSHLVARLRQGVSPSEASLALNAVLRRDELEPVARIELFAQLAEYFRAKVEFPPEATDGIADEQYVRNVLDVIYRAR